MGSATRHFRPGLALVLFLTAAPSAQAGWRECVRAVLNVCQSFVSCPPSLRLIRPYYSREELEARRFDLLHDAAERERYRVDIAADGTVSRDGIPLPDGEYMYVLGPQGGFYLHPERRHPTDPFHHATFFANAPVPGAGTMNLTRGKLGRVTNFAGCYRGDASHLKQVVRELVAIMPARELTVVCRLASDELRLDSTTPTKDHEMPAGIFLSWTPPASSFPWFLFN